PASGSAPSSNASASDSSATVSSPTSGVDRSRPARTSASSPAAPGRSTASTESSVTARAPRTTDASGIVPSNPNAPADPRIERNRLRSLRPARPGVTPAVTTRAENREAALRTRVYRASDATRDARGNYVSATHTRRVEIAKAQTYRVMSHKGSRKFVDRLQKAYRKVSRPDAQRRYMEHRDLFKSRPPRWTRWYEYGFYGGYYWDLGEFYDLEQEFWDPVIGYYFTDEWYEDIYEQWFEIKSAKNIMYKVPFAYKGVLLPTASLIDLLTGVSSMDLSMQQSFRTGLERVIRLLNSKLMAIYGQEFVFQKNDVVITHFRIKEGKGILLEGTAGKGTEQFPFKALIKFDGPMASEVFIAVDENPAARPELVKELLLINESIDKLFNDDLIDETLVPIDYGLTEDVKP
ncbi:MAG: hypothetical protein K2X47_08920, partial [Bdellovibrionales bacterium]|nr:hypothetical protein [Bdellovibrionales bacterium]